MYEAHLCFDLTAEIEPETSRPGYHYGKSHCPRRISVHNTREAWLLACGAAAARLCPVKVREQQFQKRAASNRSCACVLGTVAVDSESGCNSEVLLYCTNFSSRT